MTHKHFAPWLAMAVTLAAVLATSPSALAQAAKAASTPASANEKGMSDKAGKPPTDAAASQSNMATKKPAKAGAQSGPASGPQK
jgi:hypothetical protein